jgi:hypothetical protein
MPARNTYIKTSSGWEQIATTISAIPQGLVPVVPTSVTNGSTTADGQISFSAQTSVSLNGVFSAAYDAYLVLLDIDTAAGNTAVSLRLRAAGTDNSTASSYLMAMTGINSSGTASNITTAATSGTFMYLPSGYQYGSASITLFDPFAAVQTKANLLASGTDSAYSSFAGRSGAIGHTQAVSYDGITFVTSAAITGTIRVYGYSKGGVGSDGGFNSGYKLNQTIKLTSTTAFTKASYPWLRAVKVICVGAGGGGGGGAATSSTQTSVGGPGGGGGYSEAFITNLATLSATMYGVIGNGGNGGTAGANAGSAGTATWFGPSNSVSTGALVIANAGGGGIAGTLQSTNAWTAGTAGATVGTVPTANDLAIPGGGGTGVWGNESTITASGSGGNSGMAYGSGGIGRATTTGIAGDSGKGYGGGGSGAAIGRSTSPGQAGGAGAAGIVIIELYA